MFNQFACQSILGERLLVVVCSILLQLSGITRLYSQESEVALKDESVTNDSTKSTVKVGTVINLGKTINTELSDYGPRVSTDGKTLFMCRMVRNEIAEMEFQKVFGIALKEFAKLSESQQKSRVEKVRSDMGKSAFQRFLKKTKRLNGQEDIYVSYLREDEWTVPVCAEYPLSSAVNHEAPQSISTDNNQLFLFKNGDIYRTKRIGAEWDSLKKVAEPINSSSWDADICFSADGRTIFFASMRSGFTTSQEETERNIDIWVTVKKDSGWTEPMNLGPAINTPKTDRSPFLHSDGQTLYFSSDGHPGSGGLDLFKTTSLSDSSWTEWTEPVNLTRLNSEANDWDLTMPAKSVWAYFTSNRKGGFGKSDIYKYLVDSTVGPVGYVTLIAGKVTAPNGDPLEVEIRWENLDTGELMGMATSNALTGNYTIALPAGHHYSYYATKENYWDKSEHIDLMNLKNYKELRVNIQLQPILSLASLPDSLNLPPEKSPGASSEIILNNIFFAFDSDTLDRRSYSELNRLAEKLRKHAEVLIQIEGHTDSVGTMSYNVLLSQRRADAVRDYIIARGIDGSRLVALGYGEERPIDTNATEEGRENNRRVQFVELRTISKK